MRFHKRITLAALLGLVVCAGPESVEAAATAPETATGQTYRLYEGITAYVNNPDGKEFTVTLDARDLNLFANGPREILFKVYDPAGQPVVREIIPDDGVASGSFPDRSGGWDHELQYYANLYAKGTVPSFRWSACSEPARLNTIVKRAFTRAIQGGKKGVYRILVVGTPDHSVTLKISPDLKYGVCGHPDFMHGHGDLFQKSYIYVPKGAEGIFFAATEPDLPRTRRFKLSGPDGKALLDRAAPGGYTSASGNSWEEASIKFSKPGEYDGKLLTLEVSEGKGDYLIRVALQQPKEGAFKEYIGMSSSAIYAPDRETAMAIQGGALVVDDLVFWHPFQVRFYNWLKANKLDANDKEKALRKELDAIFDGFRMLETSDGRGAYSWSAWAYAMGYYGFKIWRPCWLLMQRADVPPELKNIVKEGLLMAGDRLSFAVGGERVNGNAFSQIPVALWYCQRATGDLIQKERFEVFFDRWQHEGWGTGVGLSRSGDSQEHFAHDMNYGSYLMDNWRGGIWVKPGILDDAKDDPRFKKVIDRYRDLYCYLYCREQNGGAVAANPWSARTHTSTDVEAQNWEMDGRRWKGEPGPDFTVSVNGGDEWFAARRKNYYLLTFHGRLAPEWMSQSFQGQLGFGGGAICQLTVPGKGPVLVSTLAGGYGEGMHPSNWRNFHIHSIVGELWDGQPLISAISEHDNARLTGNTVASSGEVRNGRVKVSRAYTFNPDSIDCESALSESDYAQALSIWSPARRWSEVKVAYEMIPFMIAANKDKPVAVSLKDGAGKDLGAATANLVEAQSIRIDQGGYGVDIRLAEPRKVKLGANNTILIQLAEERAKPTPASEVRLKYRLVPFGGG